MQKPIPTIFIMLKPTLVLAKKFYRFCENPKQANRGGFYGVLRFSGASDFSFSLMAPSFTQ